MCFRYDWWKHHTLLAFVLTQEWTKLRASKSSGKETCFSPPMNPERCELWNLTTLATTRSQHCDNRAERQTNEGVADVESIKAWLNRTYFGMWSKESFGVQRVIIDYKHFIIYPYSDLTIYFYLTVLKQQKSKQPPIVGINVPWLVWTSVSWFWDDWILHWCLQVPQWIKLQLPIVVTF